MNKTSNAELTKDQAIEMCQSNWWEGMPDRDVCVFQMHQRLLCLPFDIFIVIMERVLDRPIMTHEFINWEGMRRELMGERPAPTPQEIIELIPIDKRILIAVGDRTPA